MIDRIGKAKFKYIFYDRVLPLLLSVSISFLGILNMHSLLNPINLYI